MEHEMKKANIAFTTLAFICTGLLWAHYMHELGFSIKANLSGAYFIAMLGWLSSLFSQITSK